MVTTTSEHNVLDLRGRRGRGRRALGRGSPGGGLGGGALGSLLFLGLLLFGGGLVGAEEDARAAERVVQQIHLLLIQADLLQGQRHGLLQLVVVLALRLGVCRAGLVLLGGVVLAAALEPVQRVELLVLVEQLQHVRKAHGKAVVGEDGAGLVLLVQAVLRHDHVLHEVEGQRRDDGVEVLEMRVLLGAELLGEDVHQHLEVLSTLGEIAEQALHNRVQIAGSGDGGLAEGLVLDHALEGLDVVEVGHEADRVAAAVQAAGPDQADVAHGIADLGDEAAELVEVCVAGLGDTELADGLGQLLRALEGEALVRLEALLAEVAHVLDEAGLDVVIKEELREDEELLDEKLVREVDRRVHDAGAVRADRVGHVADVDRVQKLVLGLFLDEDLGVEVVVVLGHEQMDLAHDCKHIQTLLESLGGQSGVRHVQRVLLRGQAAHLRVRVPVVQRDRCQVVEGRVEVVRHARLEVD
eukprot:m.232378 g.232378  ORF g.232378 m.232378 type:complete len:469 (+) comp12348_c0_seq1:38-1444(+)